ncbi:unnamed protein product, partial [Mesorhabditis spiculigera]
MSVDKENIWLANLGINPQGDDTYDEELPRGTNSLGLPLIKQARAGEIFHVLEEHQNKPDGSQTEIERDMSLLSVLHDYNKTNYQLNPVFVNQDDYNAYYGGISNGILWPALHNLPQYIVQDYDDPQVLDEHWCSYVRVNYQFAINAARNSRPQDFIWIHDYHLMLVGQMMRSLDSTLEVGFFLHIPFQPPEDFMTKYKTVGMPILRAILRFKKVGFQTDRDRRKYIALVEQYIPRARIQYEETVDIFNINYEANSSCSLGVFPVSIKNEDFLSIATNDQTKILAIDIRKEDVLYQVAVTNRRTVDSYRKYQDTCLEMADAINKDIVCKDNEDWKPIIFDTDGLPRAKLIAHYLAMDIGVVTPSKDGMNLVAKEMLICNPEAGLILSSGAGTDVQLGNAGFYTEESRCYHRISDIANVEEFAEAFYAAAMEEKEDKNSLENSCKPAGTTHLTLQTDAEDGEVLSIKYDIHDELSELHKDLAFLQFIQSDDTHNVESFVETLSGFHPDGPAIFHEEVARAVELLNEGDHFQHFFTDRDGTLKSYSCSYPTSVQPAYSAVIQAQFARKCAQVCAIVTTSPLVHIGILNMLTLPEGYYAYGASAGREWYINPALQFKDDSLSDEDLNLLNLAFEKVEDLLAKPQFRNFTWIGSGLQKHYGHITIARQNQEKSMHRVLGNLLSAEVQKIVKELDPDGSSLVLKDGEFEIKIYTRTFDSEMNIDGKIFNKGHGVRLLKKKLNLKMQIGNILVCGDSENDLPMLEECLEEAKDRVYTLWVTRSKPLKEKVSKLCAQYGNSHVGFVSCPGVLLGAMAQATVRVFNMRPISGEEDTAAFEDEL